MRLVTGSGYVNFGRIKKVMDPRLEVVKHRSGQKCILSGSVSQSHSFGGRFPNGSFTLQMNWELG